MNAEQDPAAALLTVLHEVEGLPAHDIESISVLIRAGEWAVALEALCTQIYEYDCELGVDVREELIRLGAQLKVSAGYLLGDPWEKRE